MLAPTYQESLEKYYRRTHSDQRKVRCASLAGVACLTAYLGVWPPVWAALWLALYLSSELALIVWWAKVQPQFRSHDEKQILRRHYEIIVITASACAVSVIPCFVTPFSSHDNQVLGVTLSAGVLMVAASAHSLRKDMFLIAAPAPAAAFIWNLYSLGHGPTAWIFAAIGAFLVINARSLQLSSATAFLELVQLQVEADAANTAKSEFLATMSHEIRTPLNGVLGMTQVMRRGALAPEQRQQLDVIADAGQSLLSVLNGILDLSKIEAGKLELDAHPFDLDRVLNLACAPYGPLAAQKELAFCVEVASDARGVWRGDSAKLSQVISNLLSNALKFTAEGAITLKVDPAPEGLSFQVTDTGLGVAKDKLDVIFERFTQADASTTRRFGGTGLGLAICRRFVALMGGELTLNSQEGVGSTFAFILPLTREVQALAQPSRADQDLTHDPDRPLRILAAEDNPTNQLILKALLTPLEADLTLVADGHEAVGAFATGAFDLILMDVQMPRMDGLAATAAIRKIEQAEGRTHTPVIALTANVMRHQIDSYRAAGMDSHVAKPIELPALVLAIETALDPHTSNAGGAGSETSLAASA